MTGLAWIGRVLGIVGIVVCVVSVIERVAGQYVLAGFPVITLFEGGTTVLIAGCFCLLWALCARR